MWVCVTTRVERKREMARKKDKIEGRYKDIWIEEVNIKMDKAVTSFLKINSDFTSQTVLIGSITSL